MRVRSVSTVNPPGTVGGVDDHRRHDVHVRGRRLERQEGGIEPGQSLHRPRSVGVPFGTLKGSSGRMAGHDVELGVPDREPDRGLVHAQRLLPHAAGGSSSASASSPAGSRTSSRGSTSSGRSSRPSRSCGSARSSRGPASSASSSPPPRGWAWHGPRPCRCGAERSSKPALREALGDDYRDEIAPGLAEHLAQRTSRREILLPFKFRDRRVERIRDIEYVPGGGKRHRLDVLRPRVGVERGAGPLPDPRRRVGDRRQEPAGAAAHDPSRGQRMGVRRRQLPAQPAREVPGAPDRLQARAPLDQGARRRVRRRPRLHRGDRGLGRRPPRGDGGAHGQRPRVPARLPGRRHVGHWRRPDLRRLRHDGDVPLQRRQPTGSRWMEQRVLGRTFDDDPDFFRRSSPVYRAHADAPRAS